MRSAIRFGPLSEVCAARGRCEEGEGLDANPRPTNRGRLERIALLAEVAGGVAMVISVVYLAMQIADNNRLLRSQAHYNALEAAQRPFELMIANEELARLLLECDTDPCSVRESGWGTARRNRSRSPSRSGRRASAATDSADGQRRATEAPTQRCLPAPIYAAPGSGRNNGISVTVGRSPPAILESIATTMRCG